MSKAWEPLGYTNSTSIYVLSHSIQEDVCTKATLLMCLGHRKSYWGHGFSLANNSWKKIQKQKESNKPQVI